MADDISILICTHDRADVLARSLQSLREIQLPRDIGIDLVVVANACSDETVAVVNAMAPSMPFPMRCVREDQIGLSTARNRGVSESSGQIIAFLDDDVLVNQDWLMELIRFYEQNAADVVGGHVDLWWETPCPPDWFNTGYSWLLSGCDFGEAPFPMTDTRGAIGANFSFRRKVFEAIGGFRIDLGRNGKGMGAGEETDFVGRALVGGFKAFHAPKVIVRHWVPPARATPDYICSAMMGYTRSNILRKDRFGAVDAFRSVGGNAMLLLRHSIGRGIAELRRDNAGAVRHRVRVAASWGAIAGAIERFRQ